MWVKNVKKLNKKLKKFFKSVVKMMRKPVMSILPGQMSFFLLLSLIPMILLIGVISSSFSISIDNLIEFINITFPADTSKLILPLLSGKGLDYNIIILLISALLLVSKGTRSIIVAASNIYKVEDDDPIKNMIKSIIIAIILVLLVFFIIIIPVFGSRILLFVQGIANISFITNRLIRVYNLLKWPISIFIIFFNVKLIYTIAPNKQINSNTVNKGSLFTTFLWTITTFFYSFYMTHVSSYNIFYGGASSIIILMLWIYLISYIFVLGMSINASDDKLEDNNFTCLK